MKTEPKQTAQELRGAFDRMITELQAARDAIDTPELYPVPTTDRNLAEGYRYLLGFLHGSIERALDDPLHPRFRRAIHPLNKSTIDNADAVYLRTEIDGEHSYRVRGWAADSRHWRGEASTGARRAPQYAIFELSSGYAGDSGTLAELRPGSRINTSTLDSSDLQVEADGSFEILIAPKKPEGYAGNFMLSKRASRDVMHVGRHLTCRQLFHDWEHEDLLDLEILMDGCEAVPAAPIAPKTAISMLETVGSLTNNQMRFWNAFYAVTLEVYGKVPGGLDTGSDKPFMPTNDMNQPNALGIATGGGQSTNVYSGGIYQLGAEDALIIEATVPVPPLFLGFHLSNLWGESLDFESYQSSLNGQQMCLDEDGIYRWIVCHRDPGYANWLDTTGLEHGFLTLRASYSEKPEKSLWPRLLVKQLAFDDLAGSLPEHSPRKTRAERDADTLMRHRHVQRRYRQY